MQVRGRIVAEQLPIIPDNWRDSAAVNAARWLLPDLKKRSAIVNKPSRSTHFCIHKGHRSPIKSRAQVQNWWTIDLHKIGSPSSSFSNPPTGTWLGSASLVLIDSPHIASSRTVIESEAPYRLRSRRKEELSMPVMTASVRVDNGGGSLPAMVSNGESVSCRAMVI